MKRIITLSLVALFLLITASFALAGGAVATTMQLEATTGSVTVKNASGVSQTIRAGMRLYNGYTIATAAGSEAYISLDSSKAVKLGPSGKAQLKQSGKRLEVSVSAGKLFFNVTAPLKTDESLNIRTSTMVTGVRGSFGWTGLNETGLIHGSAVLTCRNPGTGETFHASLVSGQMARYSASGESAFAPASITGEDIPTFVLQELRNHPELLEVIKKDVPSIDIDEALEHLDERIEQEKAETQAAQEALEAQYAQDAGNAVRRNSVSKSRSRSGGSSGSSGGSSSGGSSGSSGGSSSGGGGYNNYDGGQTDNGNTSDGGQTDNGNTSDGGQTDNGNTSDGGKTDNGNTSDGGKTDNGSTSDGGKTDNGSTSDGGKTDNGSTSDGGKTNNGSTPDNGQTDNGNAPDNGQTENGNAPDSGKTNNGSTPDNGQTDNGNTSDSGKTDNGNPFNGGQTDNGHTSDGGNTNTTPEKEQLLKKFSVTVLIPEKWQSQYGQTYPLSFQGPDGQNTLIVPKIVYYAAQHPAWAEKVQTLPVITEIELADGAVMSPAPESLTVVGDCYALKDSGVTVTKGAVSQHYTFRYSWQSAVNAFPDWTWPSLDWQWPAMDWKEFTDNPYGEEPDASGESGAADMKRETQ